VNHVALVIPGVDRIGGAERQVLLLAKGLRQRGWQVSVVALSGSGGNEAIELAGAGVGFLSLGMRKGLADPRGWIRFNGWLRHEKPDVVHTHLPHATWLARWSRLAAPSRVLMDTLHTSSTGTLGRQLGYRYSGWLTDKITAVSQAVAEAYFFANMATADKLEVVPNGVDVEAWQPDAAVRKKVRAELGMEEEFLWFAAGRLETVKDYPALLWAMVEVPESARLVIAGSGPMQNELLRLSTLLGLERRVRFIGFDRDVLRWMQAADGYVLSSRWEGLPMGLLEAAACALPAVATDVPGTREVIINGETGWLAPAGEAALLGAAMTRMMQTPPGKRRTMGQRARQHVIDHFSLKAVLDQWEAQYSELLKRNPLPTRWGRAD
jgi:glycosyltransferase involved in cell wall biosynthesis